MSSPFSGRRAADGLVAWASGPPGGPAVVCVPWAGAGAALFRTWAPAFADDITLYAARLPGRENRSGEPPLTDLSRIVDDLERDVSKLGHSQVALFGHCSGAVVSFELARALGAGAAQLSVASQLPPKDAARIADGELSSREGLAARYLGTELLGDPDIVEMLVPVLEADMRAVSDYRYRAGGLADVPITVFRGSGDAEVAPADVDGWRAETSGPVRFCEVPGADHLFSGPAWQELAWQVAGEARLAFRA